MNKLLEPYSLEKEEEIRKFWEKEKIVEKVYKKNDASKKYYYFMDGPPYATGHIHMGTALNKILKDVAIRSRRMQGFNVFDRPGYDTHGTPIEFQIEKELGTKNRKDIEAFGVDKFVAKCREYATKFIDTMNQEFNNLGVWMDWSDPYITLKNEYIESIWFAFKKAEEQGLLYLGQYPVHICPRCETAVSFNEIEYTKLTDTSIYVKLKVKGQDNTYLMVWTTTPWTLPGNTGVMVHPKYDYSFVEMSNGETWIIAKELVQKIMDAIEAGYREVKTVKGKELKGMQYEPPLKEETKIPELKNAYRVILSERYVNLEEGTGLVHTAPGHGKEDYEEGMKQGLPAISPVELNGEMKPEAGKYAGKKARVVDKEIISDLEEKGLLVFKHPYTHDYPLCWRCKSPLLMMSVPQWFFKISGIQDRMLELNKGVQWVPNWMQDRMKNWIEGISDWPISRQRYWGTPLPIWVCGKCRERVVVGSIKELAKHAKISKELDLHKPGIDEVTFACKKCKGTMKRVSEVLDVWFDAGVSSWSALGFPQSKELFERFWPADLNIEATEQVRGWWNSQLITSTICFNKAPFKAIAVHGMILDLDKKKMSKSLGNAVQPHEVIQKFNRDFMRFYFCSVSKGNDIVFGWDAFNDIKRFFNIYWNSFNFIKIYLSLNPKKESISLSGLKAEDKWILSEFNELNREVVEAYNKYDFPRATVLVNDFLLGDFSRTYIKLIRKRTKEKAVNETMNYIFNGLNRLLAPIVPHISEYFYQNIKDKENKESIHLTELPKANKKLENKALGEEFALAKEVIQAALFLREEQKLRRRWTLKELVIESKKPVFKESLEVIRGAVNVKKARVSKTAPKGEFASKEFSEEIKLHLSTDKKGLEEEWELSELMRRIQSMRKEKKFLPGQKAKLNIACSDESFLKKYGKRIEKETSTELVKGKGEKKTVLNKEFYLEF